MKPIKEVCHSKKCDYLYDFGGPEDLHCGAAAMTDYGNAGLAAKLDTLESLPKNCLYKFEQSVAAAESNK